MPFSLTDILYGAVAPVLVTGIAFLLMRLLLMRLVLMKDLGERYPAATAVMAGFLVGYALLALAPWTPTVHWHWLPYVMIGAAIVGPIASADGLRSFERVLLFIVVAIAAASYLTPSWDDLSPSPLTHAIAFVVYVAALTLLLEPLAKRLTGPILPAVLWLTMTTTAIVLILSGSLRFGQIALPGAATFFGIMLIALRHRDVNYLTGVGLLFAMMAVGLMLIGRVNSYSNVPLATYLLVPAAPLSLWVCTVGPLAKLKGIKRTLVYAAIPIAILGVAVAMAVVADLGGEH